MLAWPFEGKIEVSGDKKIYVHTVAIEPHVHGYQSLAGNPVGAQLTKPKGWRDFPQQCDHVHVLDFTLTN